MPAKDRSMITKNPSYLTLVVAAVPPSNQECSRPVIMGLGMLNVTKLAANTWSFDLSSAAVDTCDDELEVLRWTADALPHPNFLIGENLDRDIFTQLAFAADVAPSPLSEFLRLRLARLRLALPIDLAPPSRAVPLPYDLPLPLSAPLIRSIGDGLVAAARGARADLERRAVDHWCRFLGFRSPRRSALASLPPSPG